jgi:hypothetical protein
MKEGGNHTLMSDFEKHIQSNVYTMTDRAIILRVTKKSDWTLQDILDALPSYHSQNSLKNYLTKFFTQEEIKKHAGENEPVKETVIEQAPQTVETTKTSNESKSASKTTSVPWSDAELSMLKACFPIFGTTEYMSAILYIANSKPPHGRSNASIVSKAHDSCLRQIRHTSVYDLRDIELLHSREADVTNALQAILQHDAAGVNTLNSIFTKLTQQYNIKDIIDMAKDTKHAPKPALKPAQEEQTMTKTTSNMSREDLFAAIRKLAENPDVSISVNIDFGDGCMFIWPPASKKNGGNKS